MLYSDSFHVTAGSFHVQDAHINAAIDFVRGIGALARVPLLLCPENAPGNIGEQVSRVMQMRRGEQAGVTYLIAREEGAGKDKRLGIRKQAGLDNDMTTTLTSLLAPDAQGERGQLLFSTLFSTYCAPNLQPHELASAPQRERTAVIEQLAAWELRTEGDNGRMRLVWNGKRLGNDDRTIALLYAMHFSRALSKSALGYYARFFATCRTRA